MPLWGTTYHYFLPISTSYAGNYSTGHVTTSYTYTTLSAAASSGASTVTVTSATGIANTYNIGIEQDDGTMHWTTVNGAPSGSVVTLTAVTTAAASSGNSVFVYQTRANRPLRILQAYTTTPNLLTSTSDVPVEVITNSEFLTLSNKNMESNYPLYISYEPTLTGNYKFWPRFVDGDRVIVARVHRVLEDFDASGDTPDFPQEYYIPLIYELACALAPDYNVSPQKYAILRKEADSWLEKVAQNDYEEGSIYFEPANWK